MMLSPNFTEFFDVQGFRALLGTFQLVANSRLFEGKFHFPGKIPCEDNGNEAKKNQGMASKLLFFMSISFQG